MSAMQLSDYIKDWYRTEPSHERYLGGCRAMAEFLGGTPLTGDFGRWLQDVLRAS
jgi:hypothetical protein